MRLMPIISGVAREATKDVVLNSCDLFVPKGTLVACQISVPSLQEKHWEDSFSFNPERFINEKQIKNYFPFGYGQRICIGMNFAKTEMLFCLANLLQNFKSWKLEENFVWASQPFAITVRPEKGLKVKFLAK